ncbi:MAG: hypothetical protein ACOX6Q_03690 [Candidatus Dojkabacteria bacterium]|jgi:hypothetical protein
MNNYFLILILSFLGVIIFLVLLTFIIPSTNRKKTSYEDEEDYTELKEEDEE